MNKFILIGLAILPLACGAGRPTVSSAAGKPFNIIIMLADDVGWADLACYGNRFIETPNLDMMAREGLLFTNAYAAAPLCSPSRASLITGNNPARINLTEHLHGYSPPGPDQKLITPKIETGLPPNLTTIPEALKPAGYRTAHFGKWHLGEGASGPAFQGFDLAYGGGAEGLPKTFYYPFFGGKPYPALLADTKEGDYLDDALTSKAINFITGSKTSPFFIELNFYAAHVPIEGKAALVKNYKEKRIATGYTGLPNDEYAAMVENIDHNAGRIITTIKKLGLQSNTLILFTSDNGGLNVEEVPAFAKHTPPTTNSPLRAGKGYIYEGGIREPFIAWAPSLIRAKGKSGAIISTDDVFNTCMEAAGVAAKSADGKSILPILQGKKTSPRNYYLHFPHYSPQRGKPGAVIRQQNYKLIEWYEDGRLELFDLEADAGETKNLAAAKPQLVSNMKKQLDVWRQNVNARLPQKNPGYKGAP